MDLPNISILMPIYNRSKFKNLIISNLLRLDYDFNKLEIVIDDDSDTDPLFKNKDEILNFSKIIHPMKLNYHKNAKKRSIGDKRNNLCKIAKYKILANMDSDDLYLSDYLKHSLEVMKKQKCQLTTSPQMLFCFPEDNFLITGIECPTKRMGHEATMVFTKKHFKAMGGFASKSSQGEGTNMIDGMQDKLIGKTEVGKCMVCLCHKDNTICKDRFKESQKIDIELDPFDKQLILRIFSEKNEKS